MKLARTLLGLLIAASLSACHHTEPAPAPYVKPVTDVDPAQATPEYWYDQPSVVHVPARDYDRLFAACQTATHSFLFRVDRTDYREGVITSYPNTGAQFFEFWRPDNSTVRDIEKSSLGTIRRTIRIEIEPQSDGTFQATPKVLVEREGIVARRVTAVVKFRESLVGNAGGPPKAAEASGDVKDKWWYATGRDQNLERRVGKGFETSATTSRERFCREKTRMLET